MLDLLKQNNAHRFTTVHLTKTYSIVKRMFAYKAKYVAVEAKTGVPWPVIAAIHVRESDMNFNTQLAQGDPLGHVSTHVPRGQGPYFGHDAWERAALIALEDVGARSWHDWTPGGWTTFLEKYNGLGYANRGIPSPYVWAGTNQYHSGKYIADGHFSSTAVDTQPGCVNLIISLVKLDPTINLNDLSKPHTLSSGTTSQPKKDTTMNTSLAYSWKTTLAGIAAIGAAVSAFMSAGVYDSAHLSALFAAVAAGVGMIFAKDSNVTNSPTPSAPKAE